MIVKIMIPCEALQIFPPYRLAVLVSLGRAAGPGMDISVVPRSGIASGLVVFKQMF